MFFKIMANPAVKNGYFPIANELAEQFALKNIPGNEMRILWVVLRKTWGWKKDTDRIAFSQFSESTEMKNGNVARSLKSLVAKRLLIHKDGEFKFNQNYEEWEIAKRLPNKEVAKELPSDSQKATKSVAKRIVTKERKKLQNKQGIEEQGKAIEEVRMIRDIIEAFSKINPACKKMYGNLVERQACLDLIKEYSYERIMLVVEKTLPKTNAKEFFPTIMTPLQLFKKWSSLEASILKYKGKAENTNKGRGFA
jgi:phage replication O-like protein O